MQLTKPDRTKRNPAKTVRVIFRRADGKGEFCSTTVYETTPNDAMAAFSQTVRDVEAKARK